MNGFVVRQWCPSCKRKRGRIYTCPSCKDIRCGSIYCKGTNKKTDNTGNTDYIIFWASSQVLCRICESSYYDISDYCAEDL
jgi:hypothetical protein